MSQIASLTTAFTLTMSSREIAELTGKRHDNVMRDATHMLVELYDVRDALRFEDKSRQQEPQADTASPPQA